MSLNRYAFMGINYASLRSNLIKVSKYDQLYKFKMNKIENKFGNSNLIKEIHSNTSKCK